MSIFSLRSGDDPYDAKYLLLVYGHRVYHHFLRLAQQLLSATSPCGSDKQTDENVHTLFLLLRIILLFASDFQSHAVEHHQTNLSQFKEKLQKIQMHYIEIACRFIHDQFGMAIGKQIFQKLVPLLLGNLFLDHLLLRLVVVERLIRSASHLAECSDRFHFL